MPWRIIIIQKIQLAFEQHRFETCRSTSMHKHTWFNQKEKNSDSERHRHKQRKNRYDFDREKHLLRKLTQLKRIMLLMELGLGRTLLFLRMEIFVSRSLINPINLCVFEQLFSHCTLSMELWGVPGVPCQGQAIVLPRSLYTNPGVPTSPSPTLPRSAPVSQKYLCFFLQACWEFSCTI